MDGIYNVFHCFVVSGEYNCVGSREGEAVHGFCCDASDISFGVDYIMGWVADVNSMVGFKRDL